MISEQERTYWRLLRTDFATFAERCFYELSPGSPFLWNWHIEVLAQTLADTGLGKGNRLIVNLPPAPDEVAPRDRRHAGILARP